MRITRNSILYSLLMLCFLSACSTSTKKEASKTIDKLEIEVPLCGNAWLVNDISLNKEMISDSGLTNWSKKSNLIRTYVRVNGAGKLSLGIKAKITHGLSKVNVKIGNTNKEVTIKDTISTLIPVGEFDIVESGYVQIDLQGISKTDEFFGEVSHLVIGGEATSEGTDFVKDDFYWGRRGPSVHLGYQVPENTGDVEWFYNEITVPKGEDIIGSYFMANGFGEGYFGIQVNSESERRILFSVWSSYVTDDPNTIPEDEKIILLKKGENVTTGEFGNEGSGGQSYKVFNWKSDQTYRFLLKGRPSVNNSTDYTAYFFTPEKGEWELIASFRRPKTSTYLTRPHSFLENFITEMGPVSRKANYSNQWVLNTEKEWIELHEAKFTADATARKDARLDYAGGVEDGTFYLKNCGFFNERVPFDTYHTREKTGEEPIIDFDSLP
ncbi:DUF3472 domain-containing protein [Labilibaculum sp. DW002]|uniref:DUF3472 domain-containing protein n=1 Tax=Paralabilibaculum antarcticum TaxID=2912572 RepID=A0ABT5VTP5_9BACT|nr:DUF3472 domain-containing protein [Labilibaculum sp. DW002]MDE5418795.1 DUF3472 domain-containing protein [Labilibaculum sp. DW002]